MRTLNAWLSRMAGLFAKSRRDRELEAELASHLQMQIEDNVRAGVPPEEARRQALLSSGGIESAKERYRERRSLPIVETTLQDVRFGLRVLRTTPGLTLVAIATLALAIAANTTVFSVANAILVRRPPVANPETLAVVSSVSPQKDAYAPDRTPVSSLDFLDWKAQSASFEEMAALDSADFTISGDAAPERAFGDRVSPNYFNVLGVAPALGRSFLDDENQPGRDQVVILSDELWQERYGGDPHVLGRTVKINGNRYTVVGIMPAAFHLWGQFQSQLWVPLVFSTDDLRPSARSQRSLLVVGRLKLGIDERRATAEMQAVANRIAQTHKDTNEGFGAHVATLQEFNIADSNAKSAVIFLVSAVGFVLLIACTNLANLLLSRNSARQREFSVRSILGAGRIRLARQLLTECLLLSVAGGSLGVLIAFAAVRGIRYKLNWNEYTIFLAKEVTVDGHVLIFTLAVSVLAAIVFGLVPASQMSRRDAGEGLKEGGRSSTAGPSHNRLQRLLVVAQLVLSVFLLVGTGFMVEGFIEEVRAKPGFDSHNLLTATVSVHSHEYAAPERQRQFFEAALQHLQNIPQAQSAALSSDLPFMFPRRVWFEIEGHPVAKESDRPTCGFFSVTAGYFDTTQISLLQGRAFNASDTLNSAPVVIVNKAFAKRFLGDTNPLGRHIRFEHEDHRRSEWSEVVGVAADIKEYSGEEKPRPQILAPFAANPDSTMSLIIRTRGNPTGASDSLRRAVWDVDPDQAVTGLRTMDRVIADSLQGDDLMADLMSSFSMLALLMAACGIFGALSYFVDQRRHEIGIRLALGSEPAQILRLILRNGMTLVALGTGIGFVISLALPAVIKASLQGFEHMSGIVILVLAPLVLAAVGFVACYVPARRAMRVDPMVALRYE